MQKTQTKTDQTKITKDMLIGEIIQKYPESIETMQKHGLHCIGCHVATWETLEQGVSAHGINVDALVEEINKKIRNRGIKHETKPRKNSLHTRQVC